MAFPVNEFPFSDYHSMDVRYWLQQFENIRTEWQGLYSQLTNWKTETETDLETWKANETARLNAWQTVVEQNISAFETNLTEEQQTYFTDTTASLNTWKANFETLFNTTFTNLTQIKTDAEAARDRAEAAAESVEESTEQITTNENDIADLKNAIKNIDYVETTAYESRYVKPSTGGMVGNINWDTLEINVTGLSGQTFTFSTTLYEGFDAGWAVYNSNGGVLSSGTTDSDSIVLPANCAKILISIFKFGSSLTYKDIKYSCRFAELLAMKDDLSGKVDKAGEWQVSTKNIEGMIPTGESKISYNLFTNATLVATGKYVGGITTGGKAYLLNNDALDTYIIPVDGESEYTFTNCRTAAVVSDLEYTATSDLLTYATQIDSNGGKYILFSFNPTTYPVASYIITKPIPSYNVPINWIFNPSRSSKNPTDKASGTISADGTMQITGKSAIKDGQMIAFKGKFASFAGFTLNFSGIASTNYIEVTETTIAIKNYETAPTPTNHGLTIQNEVSLTVEFIEGNAKVSLYSMGDVYTQTVPWYQTGGSISEPQIESDGTAFTEATLVTSYDCASRGIWYFGDSYIGSASQDRWCYYLKENGYMQNFLLCGSAGATSASSASAFNALLKYGTPKFAVMATGMNDGSDSNNTPPSLWSSRRDTFLTLCQNNGITPVFCTIPTVPTVNNEAKNAWVRNSGYRCIDFASAVGADGTGVWYSGMLSSDSIHPTAAGAKALYTQVLIDLPESCIRKL